MKNVTTEDIKDELVDNQFDYFYKYGKNHRFTFEKESKKVLHGTGRYIFNLGVVQNVDEFIILVRDYILSGKNL